MSSLSIVVPRLNRQGCQGANQLFENTLASILRYRMPHHQVLVVQSDLQADTYGLEEEVDFVEVPGKAGLAKYLNAAIPAVRGQVVNVIRPGVEVTHQWFAQGMRAMQDRSVASASCAMVAADYRDEVISCGLVTGRSMMPVHATDTRQRPVGPSCWAAFYRRELLEVIGELDSTMEDDFVDLDLALSLRTLGFKSTVLTDRVLTIASPQMLRIGVRQQAGRDAQRLVQRHVPREHQRVGALLAISSELMSSFWRPSRWAQLVGRFSAGRKQATDRAFTRRLAVARHELAELTQSLSAGRGLKDRHAA